MKKTLTKFLCCSLFTLIAFSATAQYKRFPMQGQITYELKVNMYAILKNSMKGYEDNTFSKGFMEDYMKKNPQFLTKKTELYFSKDKSLYTQLPNPVSNNFFSNATSHLVNANNIVAQQLDKGTATTQKRVFEETFIVQDSVHKINWKITDETRVIAGYECRRANALILDSIYVVAFYAEQIPVSSGPESFSGLPGMILGVAMPYEHLSWFATEVKDISITEDKLKAPEKGKKTNNEGLVKVLKDAVGRWGKEGEMIMKQYLF